MTSHIRRLKPGTSQHVKHVLVTDKRSAQWCLSWTICSIKYPIVRQPTNFRWIYSHPESRPVLATTSCYWLSGQFKFIYRQQCTFGETLHDWAFHSNFHVDIITSTSPTSDHPPIFGKTSRIAQDVRFAKPGNNTGAVWLVMCTVHLTTFSSVPREKPLWDYKVV